jgi:DNA-binding GntR family transcriptional regulator
VTVEAGTAGTRPQLSDEAASYVRSLIMAGGLRPGDRVRPELIASELAISTTPAREALQTLKAEGFLKLNPRKGFEVAELTGRDIGDLFVAQALIAGELAARAAKRIGEDDYRRLEAIQARLEDSSLKHDDALVEQLNHQFHRLINIVADAPKLAWVLTQTTRYVPSRFYASIPGWTMATVDDHQALLTAMRTADAEAARASMILHIQHAGTLLADYFDRLPTRDPA